VRDKTRRFATCSRPPKRKYKPSLRLQSRNKLIGLHKAGGYRMAEVNSRRESRPGERNVGHARTHRGERPAAENDGVPGLFRPDHRAERVSPERILAERAGFELLVRFVVRVADHDGTIACDGLSVPPLDGHDRRAAQRAGPIGG
jgi:hypothetical protein